MMLANVGKNAQIEKFWGHEMFEICCEIYFSNERTSDAEKSRRFLTNDPPAQKKVAVF